MTGFAPAETAAAPPIEPGIAAGLGRAFRPPSRPAHAFG
jgi:hypothetical protein